MANIIDQKLPPQSLETEQSLLGCLMIDKDAIIKIADLVAPEDFYKEAHKTIFEAILYLFEKREPIDILSLSNRLEAVGRLENIGGVSYLTTIVNVVPTSAHVVHYAKTVQKKATLRNLISAAGQIAELGFKEDEDIDQLLDKAQQSIFKVSQNYSLQNFIHIKPVLEEAFDRLDELHKTEQGTLRGVPTGFTKLDNKLAGLQKSNLIILAARPSIGKTTLALDIARNIAVVEKIPVGIFSLEMSKEEIIDKIMCSQAGVDLWKLRTGKLSTQGENSDFMKISHSMAILSESPLYIDDSASSNIMQIRTMARRLQSEHGLGLILIDYLQLMQGTGRVESRAQEVGEISRSLKALARELNVPILALSQLSRAIEARTDQMPKLSDLRESGSIEQDADLVLFIHREDKFKKDSDKKNIAKIIIAKHRNGPIGEVDLYFDPNTVSFKNIDNRHSNEDYQPQQDVFTEEF
ncbi:MAG: replicative DNA helicase [bacterium]